ncbi:MAG: hypothetical protein ABS987_03330 [Ruminococcus sp.]
MNLYPAASQPLKKDVRFSALKTWSGSGQRPRNSRAQISFHARDIPDNEMQLTCVSNGENTVFIQIGVFVLKNA